VKPPEGERLDALNDLLLDHSWVCPGGPPRWTLEQLAEWAAVAAPWFREEFAPSRRSGFKSGRKPGKEPMPPEIRLARMTKRGSVPEKRPDLGPCLLYLGATNGNGYGQFRYKDDRKNGYAHRFAWEHANGPIPDDLTVDHLCMIRNCVEVTHMELVDAVTNYRRGAAARERCRNGHEYTPSNTIRRRNGKACRTCRQAQDRKQAEIRRRPPGAPDLRIAYDQAVVRTEIAKVRRAEQTVAEAARIVGCNPSYLGRRIWRETKADVIRRDEGRCIRCEASETVLDVHHRIPRGNGGTSRPEIAYGMANLITLCRSCHEFVESFRATALAAGLLVPRHGAPAKVAVRRHGALVLLHDDGSVEPVESEVA
jgi:hypothetical protein